ncbi:MAG: hypothetical protein ACT6FE_03125 [Methanosarcinaceae archaeon]
MRFPPRTKAVLMGLLILLAVVFRYPTTPHEIGWDSFAVHLMANSVSEFGYAKWWLHPAAIIGSYPYSGSASAVPFLLSGISQCTGMDTEVVILLYSIILGLFSVFAAYLMAGAIWNNDLFKFLTAFAFSTASGIITFSTWTANARTLFIIMLPLFIYILLRTRAFKVRFCILTFFILVLLLATHHYIYFTVPIILSYFAIIIIYKVGRHVKSIKISENLASFVMFAGLLIMFLIPFFTRTLMESDPIMSRSGGGRYTWLFYMLQTYTRYMGILIIFSASGYIYLLFKRNKKFGEWFLLLCLAGLAPLLYSITYMKWFVLSFTSLLIGIAITNVATIGMQEQTHITKRKYATMFVVVLLLFSTIFAGYYQYLHFLDDPDQRTRHMEDRTYIGALWIKDAIDKDKNMIVASGYMPHRVASASKVPTLTGVGPVDLAWGFVDPDKLEVKQLHSYWSVGFYVHDPYRTVNHTMTNWYTAAIARTNINDRYSYAYRLTSRFDLSYCVENMDRPTTFTQSLQQTKNNLYDNGKIRVWCL